MRRLGDLQASGAAAMGAANWFIGLVLPQQADWIAVTADLPAGVHRFDPRDLHLTVAFLGACGPERAHGAWAALTGQRHPAIDIRAGGWMALGNPRRPSAFGLGLEQGRSTSAALMAHWGNRALHAAALPAQRREPMPHITLARPTRRGGEEARAAMEHWITTAPKPSQPALVEELALFTWAENRAERLFRVVAKRQLDAEV